MINRNDLTNSWQSTNDQAQTRQQKKNIADRMFWVNGASDAFVTSACDLLIDTVPLSILQNLERDGYSFVLKDLVSTGRPNLENVFNSVTGEKDPDAFNYTGGLHEPEFRHITIAEYVVKKKNAGEQDADAQPQRELEKAQFWQNAVIHEIGHQVAIYIGIAQANKILPGQHNDTESLQRALNQKNMLNFLGITESTEFKQVHNKEVANIPSSQGMGYFTDTRDIEKNPRSIARHETFAESFDILMRGSDSTYNFSNFVSYFPETLNLVYRLTKEQYPDFEAHPALDCVLHKADNDYSNSGNGLQEQAQASSFSGGRMP